MEQKEHCSSFRTRTTNVTGTVRFKCPNCGKSDIVRCKKARQLGTPYTCPECSFEGPN